MAETEGESRRANEAKRLEAELAILRAYPKEIATGQYLGFCIVILFLIAGTACILLGHDAAGATLAGGGLATVLGVFLYRRSHTDEDQGEDEAS